MFRSIKSRLIVWFLVTFSLLFTGLGFLLYVNFKDIVIRSIDSHLHAEVQLIAGLLSEKKELTNVYSGDYAVPLSGHYYQVVSENGEMIARSLSLSRAEVTLPLIPPPETPRYQLITGPEKSRLRLLVQTFDITSPKEPQKKIVVYAADPLEDSYELLQSLQYTILLLFPLFFLLAGFGILIITNYSLSPLRHFSRAIENIDERNLHDNINEEQGARELSPIARSFNKMLQRLEEAFSRQRLFFSNASHELRTPTSVIKSWCDVTLSKERSSGEYKEALGTINEVVSRMITLLNRILEISRVDDFEFTDDWQEIDLQEIMEEVVGFFSLSTAPQRASIKLKGESLFIEGDRGKISEVFQNLIDNALKYGGTEGNITVELKKGGEWAVVTVQDQGKGVPPEELKRIFDRFYRLKGSRDKIPGSGLGLSIVKSFVEVHGGRVKAESEWGKGTLFTLHFPLSR